VQQVDAALAADGGGVKHVLVLLGVRVVRSGIDGSIHSDIGFLRST